MRKLPTFTLLVFLIVISACTTKPVKTEIQTTVQEEIIEKQPLQQYTINNFLDKFITHFKVILQKKAEQPDNRYTYYASNSNSQWAIKINNPANYVNNYQELIKFVENENSDKDKIVKETKEYVTKNKYEAEIKYIIEEAGFSEHLAVEKTYLTLYSNGPLVMETNIKKWFYFFCAPDVIVKSIAEEREGLSNFRVTGDKEKVIAALKTQIPRYTDGIQGYHYESNAKAMRNVICPPLPENFNKDFNKMSKEGKL